MSTEISEWHSKGEATRDVIVTTEGSQCISKWWKCLLEKNFHLSLPDPPDANCWPQLLQPVANISNTHSTHAYLKFILWFLLAWFKLASSDEFILSWVKISAINSFAWLRRSFFFLIYNEHQDLVKPIVHRTLYIWCIFGRHRTSSPKQGGDVKGHVFGRERSKKLFLRQNEYTKQNRKKKNPSRFAMEISMENRLIGKFKKKWYRGLSSSPPQSILLQLCPLDIETVDSCCTGAPQWSYHFTVHSFRGPPRGDCSQVFVKGWRRIKWLG